MRLKSGTDFLGIPMGNFLQDGNQHTQSIVTLESTPGGGREVFVLGNGNGQSVQAIQMEHHVKIGADRRHIRLDLARPATWS